ncbi:MAG TPA: cytochrome C oxidase subunit IV family protein [Thermoanaerobaculia bacterium]
MTDHAHPDVAAHDAAHDAAHHGHDNSPEAIKKEVRRYMLVFGALLVLTVITVAVSQLHLPTGQAVALALFIAAIKGSLVAGFFMHLISERKFVLYVLVLTAFFFGVLMWGPWHQRHNAAEVYPGYEKGAVEGSSAAPGGGEDHH